MGQLFQQTISVKTPEGIKKISLRISVDTNGNFSTYIPDELVELFKSAGIDIGFGRGGKEGLYKDVTLNGVLKAIKQDIDNYETLELVESKIIIRYAIQTRCSYMLNEKGEVFPNGRSDWNLPKDSNWKEGTLNQSSCQASSYGFLVYVHPYVKERYVRKDGHEVIKDVLLCYSRENVTEDRPYLYWLDNVTAMAQPEGSELSEIDYTEEVAKFFVDIIKGICLLNEKIKDFLDPVSINLLVANKTKLLNM
jgi:hypothetical protein